MESKKAAKKRGIKSPDEGDAVALTVAEPVVAGQFDEDEEYEEAVGQSHYGGY